MVNLLAIKPHNDLGGLKTPRQKTSIFDNIDTHFINLNTFLSFYFQPQLVTFIETVSPESISMQSFNITN